MPPASVISCEKLMVDASERSLTPVGTVLFVAVATLWLIATSAFAYYRWSLDQTALETEATVLEYNQIRYVDAAGVTHETERPYDDGWSPSPGETVRIRYVPGSTASLERVETAAQQRQVSLILPLLARLERPLPLPNSITEAVLGTRPACSGARVSRRRRTRRSRFDAFRVPRPRAIRASRPTVRGTLRSLRL